MTTPQVPAAHPSRPRGARPRTGPAAAALVLAAACAAFLGATAYAAVTSPTPPRVVLRPLPVVVVPSQAPVATATSAPALPTTPPTAPPAPGQVKGIQAPSVGILPPVALLPPPSRGRPATQSLVPLALLATFVAILLVATVLTARRRL